MLQGCGTTIIITAIGSVNSFNQLEVLFAMSTLAKHLHFLSSRNFTDRDISSR